MTAIIGGLVALACALLLVGMLVRIVVGDTTLLRIGGMVFGISLLPSVALGLYQLFAERTPGGMEGFGLLFGAALIGIVAFVAFRYWLALERGARLNHPQKVERKRSIFDTNVEDPE